MLPYSGFLKLHLVLAAISLTAAGELYALSDVSAVYNAATDVPVTAAVVTATGATVTFSLNYVPATGTTLTVVNNTGLGFINGQFSNLAQGQTVMLSYGGISYNFVANYYGGTGNDLVLVWKNNRAFAWGYNSNGQLGNNNNTPSTIPVAVMTAGVLAGKTVLTVANGFYHSVALCSDGTLAAWGDNAAGELGNNSTTPSTVPVAVTTTGVLAGKTIVAVAAGNIHSLALCSDGTLAAWGYNVNGQLGNNSTTQSTVPVAVNTAGVLAGKTVVAIAAGNSHNLALCSDGTLASWGANSNGQLGNNSTTNSTVPVAVNTAGVLAGKTVVTMGTGVTHSFALCSDGSLISWGSNGKGELGNNSTTNSTVPVAVTTTGVLAGKTVLAVAGGFYYSVALCSDGTLASWGYNVYGQLGNNSTTDSTVPVAVDTTGVLAGKTIAAVTTGGYHNLVLCTDGTLASWGYNNYGQLGTYSTNSTTNSTVPVAVEISPLAIGERFIFAARGQSAYHTLALVAAPTAPAVTTLAASSITTTAATLNGTVNARDNSTAISFDFGTSIAYGSSVAATPSPVIGSSNTAVTTTLTGLTPGTVYHYRAQGVNVAGTGTGSDRIFATALSDVSAVYSAATDVPVTAAAVNATGATVTFSLNYAPATGTTLTVVNNTGLDFINGQFSNLAQGQTVTLSFGGVNYNFVANYYGGTGNDLVLGWKDCRAFAWGNNSNGQLGNNSTTISKVPVAVNTAGVLAGKTVIAVAAGNSHNLALCSDGTLASWGYNFYGQLGNNSTTLSTVPVAVNTAGVLAGKTVVAVAAGDNHSVALCSDGTLASWGYNYFGQLGNNSGTDSTVPVAVNTAGVLAGKTVVSIAAGNLYSLALCSDGTLASWGNNGNGQLGNNSTTTSTVPVAVTTTGVLAGKTIVAVAAGNSHSLALCSDGTLASWGYNGYGQLGNNSTTQSTVPVAVTTTGVLAGKTVVTIATGLYHSLARCSDGTLASWGYNGNGQLGNNSTTQRTVPVAVTTTGVLADKTVVAVSAGNYHSLALCSDGNLASWGYNGYGQLGNNNTTSYSTPVAVDTSPLAAGERFIFTARGLPTSHTLTIVASPPPLPAVTTLSVASITPTDATLSGTVMANNLSTTVSFDYGTSIAYGSNIAATPSPVTGSSPTAVTTTLTGLTPGTVYHYRAKGVNVTGPNTGNDRIFATALANVSVVYANGTEVPVTAEAITATGATATFSLNHAPVTGTTLTVVNNTGLDFINGQFSNLAQGQTVTLSFGGVNYNFVANYYGGTGNDLVLIWKDSRAFAWGWGGNGQLGYDNNTNSTVPVAVTATGVLAGKTVVATAAGYAHSLALCSDGTLAAWGGNSSGTFGNNSTTSSKVPVEVTSTGVLAGKTVVAVAAGTYHSLALCSDGTLATWGWNNYGQLGNNSNTASTVPVAVNTAGALAGKTVVSIAAGNSHNLALCSDGTLAAWGYNGNGPLGNNSTTNSIVPVAVTATGVLAGKTIVAVAAGNSHSLALCSDGTLASWGYNGYGQLGDNSTTQSTVPVAVNTAGVLAGKTVVTIATGLYHSLALCSDGTLASWGYNNYGQLGTNDFTQSLVPVPVTATGVLAGKTVVAIATGNYHSIARCSDGTLASWGGNDSGQLGNNSTTQSTVPVAVNTSPLAAGERFIFAARGPVATHTLALVAAPPTPVVTTLAATSITPTGATLNSAINARDNSTAVSFDYGTSIAYGNSIAASPSPVIGSNPAAVSTTLTGLNPGTVYHYRAQGVSDAGNGAGNDRIFATALTNLSAVYNAATDVPVIAEAITAIGATVTFSLNYAPVTGTTLTVVNNTGLDFINGQFSNLTQGQAVMLSFGGVNYNFVANYYGGTGNDLVLIWKDRRAFTWGDNSDGQLGNNSTTQSTVPVAVTATGVLAGKTVVAVAAGTSHSLALCSDGTLASWGYNNNGQLGNNSTTNSTVPVAVTISGALAGRTIVTVAAGTSHSLALCSDGTLASWGGSINGQLGNNNYMDSATPVSVTGVLAGRTVVAVAAGSNHSLALCSDGTLASWGWNGSGQLGNNSYATMKAPMAITIMGALAGRTVVAVAAGSSHSLALCSDGTLTSWGDNSNGQLGNNSTMQSTVPVAVTTTGVLADKTVVALAAGIYHSVACCSDGTMASWGYNFYGQLGNNSTTQSTVPVAVNTGPLATGERFIQSAIGQPASLHTLALVAAPPALPAVTTLTASNLTPTGATLNGTIMANNNSTAVSFDYGTSIAYGSSIAATPTQVTGSSPTAVTATLTGLTPGTVYYYRIKGVSLAGTTNGTGLTFTTLTVQQAWRKTYFGSINNSGNAADAFDYDGDGLTNLTEWACNLNPTTSSTLTTPLARNGATLTFDYSRSVAAVNAGVSFSVKWSDTLALDDWHPDDVTVEILSDNGTTQQVRATLPAGNLGRRFIQLQITAP